MIMDLEKYKLNRDFIHSYYKNTKGKEEVPVMVAVLACSTMCPAVVVAFYLAEVHGWQKDMIDHVKSLIEFYGYTEIKGKDESCPL